MSVDPHKSDDHALVQNVAVMRKRGLPALSDFILGQVPVDLQVLYFVHLTSAEATFVHACARGTAAGPVRPVVKRPMPRILLALARAKAAAHKRKRLRRTAKHAECVAEFDDGDFRCVLIGADGWIGPDVVLASEFSCPLDKFTLPPHVKSLTIECNLSLVGASLPASLEHLTFGVAYNQSLVGVEFPLSLKSLVLGAECNASLVEVNFPTSLESLTLGAKERSNNPSLVGVRFPASLKRLVLGQCYDVSLDGVQLPASLKHIVFGDFYRQPLAHITLPETLESIEFGTFWNSPLPSLPQSVRHITFGAHFSQPVEHIRLANLEYVKFGLHFNQPVVGLISHSPQLKHLEFFGLFNQRLPGEALPESLTHLILSDRFNRNQPLLRARLPRLTHVEFGDDFCRTFAGVELPPTLVHLSLGRRSSTRVLLDSIALPASAATSLCLTLHPRIKREFEPDEQQWLTNWATFRDVGPSVFDNIANTNGFHNADGEDESISIYDKE